jgi:hypothetical protein
VVGRSPGLTRAGKDDEQDGDGEVQDPAHDARPTGDERAGALERGRFARRYGARGRTIVVSAARPRFDIDVTRSVARRPHWATRIDRRPPLRFAPTAPLAGSPRRHSAAQIVISQGASAPAST